MLLTLVVLASPTLSETPFALGPASPGSALPLVALPLVVDPFTVDPDPTDPEPIEPDPNDPELSRFSSAFEPVPASFAPPIIGSSFSYTYFELGGILFDADNEFDDVDAYYARAQLSILGIAYLLAGYDKLSSDFESTDADLFRLGAGAHLNLGSKLDLTGEFSLLFNDVESDVQELDGSESGYELRIGARWWAFGNFEIDGGLVWIDLDNRLASDDQVVGWEVGARYHFLKLLSVGAGYSILEDDDQLLFNARVSL